jgi:predicted nucleic acid-binding protein
VKDSVTVYLDSNCVIYLIESNPTWGPKVTARLGALRSAGAEIALSDRTRTECLIGPLNKGDAATLKDYQTFFASPAVKVLSLTAAACERAAYIRVAAQLKLKVPDCLHLAVAAVHGCRLFLTNDEELTRCTEISVEVLS